MEPLVPLDARLPAWPVVDFSAFGPTEAKPLSRLQTLTAGVMARNWLTIPHVTHHDDADITSLEAHRKAWGSPEVKAPSPLAYFAKALVCGLREYPQFNASLDATGKLCVFKKYFNVGIAIDSPRGLVVGVVRDCDRKSIRDIGEAITDLAAKARGKGLPLADMEGGCMSISSLGGIGGTGFTPIINAPEVAILGITKADWKPLRGLDGQVEWRLKAPMSLSYDHRVINGADAARFLRHIDEVLADPARLSG